MPVPQAIAPVTPPTSMDLVSLMRPVDPAQSQTVPRLAASPNVEFFLRHHPAQWEAESDGLDEMTWLPDIGPMYLAPGAHLVRTRRSGEDPRKTWEHAANVDGNKGWIQLDAFREIPTDCLPPGVPAGGYLRGVQCKDPKSGAEGVRYIEAWSVPAQPVPGRPQRFKFDRASYNRWRLWLVTSGQVPAPSPDVIAEMKASKQGRPARIASLTIPDDLRKQRLAEVNAEIARMEEAVEPEPEMVLQAVPVKREPKAKASKPSAKES